MLDPNALGHFTKEAFLVWWTARKLGRMQDLATGKASISEIQDMKLVEKATNYATVRVATAAISNFR